jgi:NAD-dependent deacetylase
MDARVAGFLDRAAAGRGRIVFLTGPGLLVESGVPIPHGEEGRWRSGARTFHPVELATMMSFQRLPGEVWGWYLYRRAVGRAAAPNPAHDALASLERRIGDRFLLVTENVNGLHLRAGNSEARTYQIHGNLNYARCAAECGAETRSLPEDFAEGWPKDRAAGDQERVVLTCGRCGAWLRPNVVWFDEPYDEDRFRGDSALGAAVEAAALIVVGTTGAPMLSIKMCQAAMARGVPVLAVHSESTPLAEMATASPSGVAITGSATALVPALCERLASRLRVA